MECVGCADTGLNSKGGLCHPCKAKGRQTVKDTLVEAVADLFDAALGRGRIPTEADVLQIVEWAYVPKVTYAAGFRGNNGGSMVMFAGPSRDIDVMLQTTPPRAGTAYIVRLTKQAPNEEPKMKPMAKWRVDKWRIKKAK